jgi:hypothetical protein
MVKIIGILWGILALWLFGCHSGERKAGDLSADSTWTDRRGNISFVFPSRGYAYKHRQQLIQECLDGVKYDLGILNLQAFTDTFTIRFLDSRQEMKRYVGNPSSGVAIPRPFRIVYMVFSEKEEGAPIKHELMHMICLVDWGDPDPTSLWMNEGLAAFSQNSCNGFTDEQIYRYFAANRMLLPIDSLANAFYQEPEMITYHQAGWMVGYLLKHYGVGKLRDLWQQGLFHFNAICGTSFSHMEADIKAAAERDYPKAPEIDWTSFSVGCQ